MAVGNERFRVVVREGEVVTLGEQVGYGDACAVWEMVRRYARDGVEVLMQERRGDIWALFDPTERIERHPQWRHMQERHGMGLWTNRLYRDMWGDTELDEIHDRDHATGEDADHDHNPDGTVRERQPPEVG